MMKKLNEVESGKKIKMQMIKGLNEVIPFDDLDAFEILDLEEKLDYDIWGGDECDCDCFIKPN